MVPVQTGNLICEIVPLSQGCVHRRGRRTERPFSRQFCGDPPGFRQVHFSPNSMVLCSFCAEGGDLWLCTLTPCRRKFLCSHSLLKKSVLCPQTHHFLKKVPCAQSLLKKSFFVFNPGLRKCFLFTPGWTTCFCSLPPEESVLYLLPPEASVFTPARRKFFCSLPPEVSVLCSLMPE